MLRVWASLGSCMNLMVMQGHVALCVRVANTLLFLPLSRLSVSLPLKMLPQMSVKVQVSLCVCTAAVEISPLPDCAWFDSEWDLFLGTLHRAKIWTRCIFIDLGLWDVPSRLDEFVLALKNHFQTKGMWFPYLYNYYLLINISGWRKEVEIEHFLKIF